MATEIERKFLVTDDRWRNDADGGTPYRQGYLVGSERASVRVRLQGEKAYLNIKSATLGVRRLEFEYPVPAEDARVMLESLCDKPLIEKTRHFIDYGGHRWEIDVFGAENAGLVVAEIELDDEQEDFERPPWLGEEVSHDPRYYNVSLVRHPYKDWS
ncbi:MAG TPA: CYTH domain-containing protein [Gammaproteobacteria bacterium]|nr:CYTH domain-containing protein [Gammaproteobacteria bacterium]